MADSWFDEVKEANPIEVFALTASFNEDAHPNKVNLGVGAYRTDECKPWVLPVVNTVENQMAADPTLNHEYLPVAGNPTFRDKASRLVLGDNSKVFTENRCDSIQALGGTGAIYIALNFLHTRIGLDTAYVSNPTWGNHKNISKALGYKVCEYRYWDEEKRSLDFAGFKDDLKNAPTGSVILLHACAHNPTGMDPTHEQWKELAVVIREKRLFPLFDCAYQGFASGDLDADAWAIRYFVDQGFELFVCQSFSKNFGLYNERVGNMVFVTKTSEAIARLRSQLMMVVRTTWSNSANHGSRIVATVLNNSALYTEWVENVRTMAERIMLMRKRMHEKLRALGTPGNWDHIISQSGMFSYTGLSPNQVERMVRDHHVYLLKSGRINMCGLTSKNIDYVANAIHDVVTRAGAQRNCNSVKSNI